MFSCFLIYGVILDCILDTMNEMLYKLQTVIFVMFLPRVLSCLGSFKAKSYPWPNSDYKTVSFEVIGSSDFTSFLLASAGLLGAYCSCRKCDQGLYKELGAFLSGISHLTSSSYSCSNTYLLVLNALKMSFMLEF